MAGNFWRSSHYQQWILDKQDLIRGRQQDLFVLTEEEYQKIFIFFVDFIQVLGEQLNVRQQVIATAVVYFKRFYACNSLKSIDPLLLAPTCLFLASKVEEFAHITNNLMAKACTALFLPPKPPKEEFGSTSSNHMVKPNPAEVRAKKFFRVYGPEYPYRANHFTECEFYLLENLDCCLIVYQPYRPLLQLIQDMGHEDQLLSLAWRLVNDSLQTDVCLLYAPYQIAIGCLLIACVVLQKELLQLKWFAELIVDIDKIQEITWYIINFFEFRKSYNEEKEIQALLAKMPKPKLKNNR